MQARLALSWVDPRKYRHCVTELPDPASPASFSSLETVVNVADARLYNYDVQLFFRVMRARQNSRILPALCSLLLKTNYAQIYRQNIRTPSPEPVWRNLSISRRRNSQVTLYSINDPYTWNCNFLALSPKRDVILRQAQHKQLDTHFSMHQPEKCTRSVIARARVECNCVSACTFLRVPVQ